MTPRRPTSSKSGTRRVARGARPRQVPVERAASSTGSASGSAGSEPEGLPTTAPERVLPPRVVTLAVVCLLAFVVVFTSLRAYLSQQAQYDAVGDTSYVVVGADSVKQPGASGGATQGSQDAPWYQTLRESSQAAGQSEDKADGASQDGSRNGSGGKTLNPTEKGLPTGAPSQAPSEPPRTSPSPAPTPQTKETP